MKPCAFPCALLALAAAGACAQVPRPGGPAQISVDLTDVAPALAERLKLDGSRIPLSMLVPADVAAEACSVPLPSLSPKGCRAVAGSARLDQLLLTRLLIDEPPPESATPPGAPPPGTRP